MNLGVAGNSGVAIDVNLVQASGGGGNQESGDVDERPTQNFELDFKLPRAIKDAGLNARALISFCVDANGNAYDLQVLEESPTGLGMVASAKQALQKAKYSPAKKDGRSVSFCGMEQPFEVKFD